MTIRAACAIWEGPESAAVTPSPCPLPRRGRGIETNGLAFIFPPETTAVLELHIRPALGIQHHAGLVRCGDVDGEFLQDVADLGDEGGV